MPTQFEVVRRFTKWDRGAYSAHAWLAYGARISARGKTRDLANEALERKITEHVQSASAFSDDLAWGYVPE